MVAVNESARNEWRQTFAEVLAPLADSVTAHGRELPDLGNVEYRALAGRAAGDLGLQELLSQYLTEIAGDPGAAIGLVLEHPAAGGVFGGRGKDAATYVTMPGKGFRVELKQFAHQRSSLKRQQPASARMTMRTCGHAWRSRLTNNEAVSEILCVSHFG